jgi:hypothetical protein
MVASDRADASSVSPQRNRPACRRLSNVRGFISGFRASFRPRVPDSWTSSEKTWPDEEKLDWSDASRSEMHGDGGASEMALSFEFATENDIPALLRLRLAVDADQARRFGTDRWTTTIDEKRVARGLKTSRVLVATDHGRILGAPRMDTKKPWTIGGRRGIRVDRSYLPRCARLLCRRSASHIAAYGALVGALVGALHPFGLAWLVVMDLRADGAFAFSGLQMVTVATTAGALAGGLIAVRYGPKIPAAV